MSDQIEKTGSGRPGLAESGAVQRPDGKSCGQVRPLPDPTIPTPRTDAAITCGFPLMVEAESMRVVERELVEAHDKHAAWLEGALDATRELSRLHGEEVERLKGAISESPNIPRWVSTDERNPEDGQTVLGGWVGPSVCDEGMESLIYHAADAPDGPECWRDVFGEERDPPTHWTLMELPK